jgi:hypothetical protein
MSAISDRVLSISKPYLGPAAESFLSRQCKSHLKTEIASLNAGQVKELAKWVELGAGLIMDPSKASELAKKIASLSV